VTAATPAETVLFDVDGTLIDSNGAHAQAWVDSLREHGISVGADQIRRLIGMGGDKLLAAVAHVNEHSELGQAITLRKKAIFETLLPGLQPTLGARALLEYLRDRGVTVVIATSADDREMSALLQRAGVSDLVPARTSKGDVQESKPDPDIVQAALAKAHGQPESSVMVGDTPYDIEAAARSGIGAIALRCGGYWTDHSLRGAREIFDDPEALLAFWRRLVS